MFQFCKICHSKVAGSGHSIGGRRWVSLSMALLPLLVPRIAPAQESSNKTQRSGQQLMARNENVSKDAQNAVPVDPKYAIGAQDVLSISVWKESDLTETVVVRPDGRISLPLVNDVQAAGLTPMQLAGSVTAELRTYALFPGMTLLQALSSAGGFTQFADVKKIYLLRTENGGQAKFLFNYKEVVHGRAPEQNIALRTGDTLIVP